MRCKKLFVLAKLQTLFDKVPEGFVVYGFRDGMVTVKEIAVAFFDYGNFTFKLAVNNFPVIGI